eukprot:CAMPEP_0168448646 /NCGR_PEP_ID=MMETSP0228-20121227/47199_1 /TAXON_ID=133427 /ORGANISM="Protoceratium reticulatum, Strain CCCM 535 (=CCMP 1889)" /LENGTH=267 /DNA_ID=CAMNT_0008463181 /DNA_START=80 /DNA_END=881 /DNA_ORIENTATION=-
MSWLFGSCMVEPDRRQERKMMPDLHHAARKVEDQVARLEDGIAKAEEEIKVHVSKGPSDLAAKQRAVQAIKRKKMYEQQRDQLLGTQFNLENLGFHHDQAEITLTAVNAMKRGHEQLKHQTSQIDAGMVDRLRDDMEDMAEDMKAIGEALGASMGPGGQEEEELSAEYAKMQEEQAAQALAGTHLSSGASPTINDDEYERLLAAASKPAAVPARRQQAASGRAASRLAEGADPGLALRVRPKRLAHRRSAGGSREFHNLEECRSRWV